MGKGVYPALKWCTPVVVPFGTVMRAELQVTLADDGNGLTTAVDAHPVTCWWNEDATWTDNWINQRHISEEALDRAIARVVDAYHRFALPRHWGLAGRLRQDTESRVGESLVAGYPSPFAVSGGGDAGLPVLPGGGDTGARAGRRRGAPVCFAAAPAGAPSLSGRPSPSPTCRRPR